MHEPVHVQRPPRQPGTKVRGRDIRVVHAAQTSISSSHAGDGEEWTDPTHCSTAALAGGGGGGGGGGAKISRHFGMSFYQ